MSELAQLKIFFKAAGVGVFGFFFFFFNAAVPFPPLALLVFIAQ